VSSVLRDQVWRNIHGSHVRVDGVGPYRHDTIEGEALWVDVCDADGNVTGSRIPMEIGGFPGPLWTLVKA
jgi:hypothetical protein